MYTVHISNHGLKNLFLTEPTMVYLMFNGSVIWKSYRSKVKPQGKGYSRPQNVYETDNDMINRAIEYCQETYGVTPALGDNKT
jgi:hypothetical protein